MNLDALPGFITGLFALGVAGVALAALLEKLIPVVPSYVLYVVIGSSMLEGAADLLWAIPVSAAAGAFGGLAWYAAGRALGERRVRRWVVRHGRWIGFDRRLYQRMRRAYRKQRFAVTLVGHSIPVVRFYLPIPAGIIALPLAGFLLASTLGGMLWNGALMAIGLFADALEGPALLPCIIAVCALLVLELAAFALWHRWRGRREVVVATP